MHSEHDLIRRYAAFPSLFRQAFEGMDVDAALLGSGAEKDLDLLIVARESRPIVDLVGDATRRLVDLQQSFGCTVIVKHEHRALAGGRKPILHVMFYPSMAHAITCELPSLLAYTYDRGIFLAGDRSGFEAAAYAYRRGERPAIPLREAQMHRYADIAITSLIYLVTNGRVLPYETLQENLLYVLRFATAEALVDRLPPDAPVGFWDWDELIAHVEQHLHADWLLHLFRNRHRVLAQDRLASLLQTACDITERGLGAFSAR